MRRKGRQEKRARRRKGGKERRMRLNKKKRGGGEIIKEKEEERKFKLFIVYRNKPFYYTHTQQQRLTLFLYWSGRFEEKSRPCM